jgi:hypothetical protein
MLHKCWYYISFSLFYDRKSEIYIAIETINLFSHKDNQLNTEILSDMHENYKILDTLNLSSYFN